MIIKIGDKVEVSKRGINRDGIITDISIGLTTSDPAGELGIKLKEYDTDMGYLGSISYKDVTFDNDSEDEYWCYFDQIVTKQKGDGVQMCYKITTHSSSGVYNTKIHATSMGWS